MRSSQDRAPSGLDFRSLFEQEYRYVRATARRLGIRERELPDLIHDVFVTVHRKLPTFEAGRPVRPWLFGITFRIVVGHKRRLGYSREQLAGDDDHDQHPDDAPRADQQMELEERKRMVHEALEALDDERRAVFVLHEIDEVPVPEIARALELPENTAYSRLRLGREEFRRALVRIAARETSKGGLA